MATIPIFVDLLTRRAIRSATSAAPISRPDFRDPASHTVQLFFMQRQDNVTENYNYVRFSSGVPIVKLRRNKAPDYCTFVLSFNGYDSIPIDSRLTNDQIAAIIGAMPSVGQGNVSVTGDVYSGWSVEFTGAQAGYAQPMITGRVVSPSNGEVVISETQIGGAGTNEIQLIRVREAALATATAWTELTASSQWGWQGTLDTTAVLASAWDNGDMIAEVTMANQGVRSGSDGATSPEGTGRTGTDGVITTLVAETGQVALASRDANGSCYLIARSGSNVYGRLFRQSDVGRSLTNNTLFMPSTVIASVVSTPTFNAAKLDRVFNKMVVVDPVNTVTYDLGAVPSYVYKSATAAFAATDIGHLLTGDNLGSGIVIQSVLAADTVILTSAPTGSGSSLHWTLTTLPSNLFSSASAAFTSADVGAQLISQGVSAGTFIVAVISGTQVQLSQVATAVGSSLSWTLRRKTNFAVPTVNSIIAGTMTSSETQQLALVQSPVSGYITLRDGADVSLPVVKVAAPISAGAIAQALNIGYPNYGGVAVTEVIPGGTYNIKWAISGKQWVMVVDDTNAVYATLAVSIGVGPLPPTPDQQLSQVNQPQPSVLAVLNRFNLKMMGVNALNWLREIRQPVVTPVTDGTGAYQLRRYFIIVMDQYVQPPIGQVSNWAGVNYYLDAIENIRDAGGLRNYEWVGYSIPPGRSESIYQNKTVYIPSGSVVNGVLVDLQLSTVSQLLPATIFYSYAIQSNGFGAPAIGFYLTIIHYSTVGGFSGDYQEILADANGAHYGPLASGHSPSNIINPPPTSNVAIARRRWRSNIWEQAVHVQ